ncbi:hypothetical protein HDU98_007104 [Podochytrium sp. JEL0797]|nr:hypothetical protein HDU98_007104 [Podochytrium sp. JEL0797]
METNDAGGTQQPVYYSHPQKGSQENLPSETEENPISVTTQPAAPQPPPAHQTPPPIPVKLFRTMEAATAASSATPTPAESPPEYQVFSQSSSTSTLIQLEAQPASKPKGRAIMTTPIGYVTPAQSAGVAPTAPPTQETPAEEEELHWLFFRTRRGGRITVAAVVLFIVILFSVLGGAGVFME